MLDVYKDKQPLFYNEVMNSIMHNKISHAYMIESNNYSEKDLLLIEFVKELFCSYNKANSNKICNLIDNNSFSDFIIVEPDGSFIKKEQVLDIKEKFKTTSFSNNPRIYLIKNADKLNKQAANSLLKFLEEPDGNVIAILETDNRYKVLETIASRCQILSLINNEVNIECKNIELVTEIIHTLENNKEKAIAYLPICLNNDYQNKNFWYDIFSQMIIIYDNAIRKLKGVSFIEYDKLLDYIIDNNNLNTLIRKVDVLFKIQSMLEYNLNVIMMLDNFILEFSGGE